MSMRARQKIRAPRRGLAPAKTDDFDDHWDVLSVSLSEINTKNASSLSFEELYRNAYKLVLMTRGEELYAKVKQFEEDWLCSNVQKRIVDSVAPILLRSQQSTDLQDLSNERRAAGEKFLAVVKKVWEDHQLCMGMITDVLMYMDRTSNKPPIFVTSMALFRHHVVRARVNADSLQTVESVLVSTILFMVQLERTGHIIDRPLVRHCVQMLEGLYETLAEQEGGKLYLTTFQPAFLDASTRFYSDEGRKLLENGDAAAFCFTAMQRIQEEMYRAESTLSSLSMSKVIRVIDECFIRANIEDVVLLEGTGVRSMLQNNQLTALCDVYHVNQRVDPLKTALTNVIKEQIVEMGRQVNALSLALPAAAQGAEKPEKGKEKPVNQQTTTAIQWVDDVLGLKNQFDKIWKEALVSDQGLQKSIMASFSKFINMNYRSSEYLSLFFDENLKKGIKGKTESEVDALLDNGITLLRYIRAKDLFETYYKKHLSRRLLMKRTASMDAERQMISKMKVEVGNQFTQRIEAMFKDMTISEDLAAGFKEHVALNPDPENKPIDLEINVLTSTMWPMETMPSPKHEAAQQTCVTFPRDIENLKQGFEKFYHGKHSGRKLSWQAGMGTADIRATFRRNSGKVQRYELNVSTYALIILLLFNDVPDGESLTYEEIQLRTNIREYDLIRNLQSLAVAPKTRVLKKDPMSKDVKSTDKFSVNNEFQSPFMKVRIGVVSGGANKVENQDQRKDTEKKMNDERKGSIEAAVVRIMKQRKRLTHSQLMTEILSQLSSRFTPDVNMIKRRIESLIDREYLERVVEDPATYGYVA